MHDTRITVRLQPDLRQRLRREANRSGKNESAIVREALESYLGRNPKRETAYDVLLKLGLIGCVKDAPPDLSTNKKYFAGFGKPR